jgi:hypothetical protein
MNASGWWNTPSGGEAVSNNDEQHTLQPAVPVRCGCGWQGITYPAQWERPDELRCPLWRRVLEVKEDAK